VGIKAAYLKLVSTVEQATPGLNCVCFKCDFHNGWLTSNRKPCPRNRLWEEIGKVLSTGLLCFLVNPHGDVAVPGTLCDNWTRSLIDTAFSGHPVHVFNAPDLLRSIYDTFANFGPSNLGRSSGTCTIYSTVLETLEVHPDGLMTFELLDGRFMFEGRSYKALSSSSTTRPKAEKSLLTQVDDIVPTNHGEHSSLSVTLREGYRELVLQVTARCSGSDVRIDLASVIIGYVGLERTQECEHVSNNPLGREYKSMVTITGVASPTVIGSQLALAMTHSNSVAQFLCCESGTKQILLYECCLDCGFKQAKDKFDVLIVS